MQPVPRPSSLVPALAVCTGGWGGTRSCQSQAFAPRRRRQQHISMQYRALALVVLQTAQLSGPSSGQTFLFSEDELQYVVPTGWCGCCCGWCGWCCRSCSPSCARVLPPSRALGSRLAPRSSLHAQGSLAARLDSGCLVSVRLLCERGSCNLHKLHRDLANNSFKGRDSWE